MNNYFGGHMKTTDLTTKPVSKLFFQYLIPSICGTMVTSIYVLADTIIIGKGIGIDAMAGLNIILPVFNLFFGTGLLLGVGGSVLMSVARGRGNTVLGEHYFTAAFLGNLLLSILYTAIFALKMPDISRLLGGSDITMPYIMDYFPYIIMGIAAFSFSTFLQTFVRNDGAPKLSMAAVISGGVLNVILDIVFVYPCRMGMAGAAIASVLGSLLTDCILITHFFSKKNGLHFRFKGLVPAFFGRIFANGFTSFLIEISSGIVIFVFNLQILRYIGDIGVSMYGVITNSAIVVTCLCNGISQAAQPILSTNFGAGHYDRIENLRRLGIRTAFVICSVPALLGLIVPDLFTYIFLHPTKEILELSATAVRIYFLGFFVTGINMFTINYFQATVQAVRSLTLCLLRGCLLNILFIFILPAVFGITGIWACVPLCEFISLILGICLLKTSKLPKKEAKTC